MKKSEAVKLIELNINPDKGNKGEKRLYDEEIPSVNEFIKEWDKTHPPTDPQVIWIYWAKKYGKLSPEYEDLLKNNVNLWKKYLEVTRADDTKWVATMHKNGEEIFHNLRSKNESIKKSEVVKLIKELIEDRQGLQGLVSEVCRCLSKFNVYEFTTNNPDQAQELKNMLKRIQDICVNAPVTSSNERQSLNTPELLRR